MKKRRVALSIQGSCGKISLGSSRVHLHARHNTCSLGAGPILYWAYSQDPRHRGDLPRHRGDLPRHRGRRQPLLPPGPPGPPSPRELSRPRASRAALLGVSKWCMGRFSRQSPCSSGAVYRSIYPPNCRRGRPTGRCGPSPRVLPRLRRRAPLPRLVRRSSRPGLHPRSVGRLQRVAAMSHPARRQCLHLRRLTRPTRRWARSSGSFPPAQRTRSHRHDSMLQKRSHHHGSLLHRQGLLHR